MLPYGENTDDLTLDFEEDLVEETKTFKLNINENVVGGTIDELEALKQSIYLMLTTEADKYIIFPYTYGITTVDLIGKPYYYVMAVFPDRVKETLLSDNRITDVSDFEFNINGNKLNVKFIVHSIYGEIEEETVVNY